MNTLRNLILVCVFSFLGLMNSYAQDITQYLKSDAERNGLTKEDISDWVITSQYSDANIQHIYHRQRYDGIEIFTANGGIHILSNGEVLISDIQYIKDLKTKITAGIKPGISAIDAVNSASKQLGYTVSKPITILENLGTRDQALVLSNGGISRENIPAKLMYYPVSDKQIVLTWDFSIYEPGQQNWWSIRVDASTGAIVDKSNWVVSCSPDEIGLPHNHDGHIHGEIEPKKEVRSENMMVGGYNVFPLPVESPNFGARVLVLNPDNALASPFGWHDTNGAAGAEFTNTSGNNVFAYEDGNNPNFAPNGGAGLLFDFPLDLNYSLGNQSESAVITNLFYWNNIIHDVLYQHGFHEAGGNFQENNYGKGGVGSDYVNAEAQDGSGTCNANFGTPPDGFNPTMQMYVCNTRDGDIDNGVIIHEYGHGVSNRLTGGPSNVNCLNNQEQMGEGWSDWYAIMLTMKPGDIGPGLRPMGTWLFGQGPTGPGIRPYPYTTNLAVNPHTYNSIKTAAVPHGVGSVWCAMLWEVTWALINQYGYSPDYYNGTAGNVMALKLITLGMKLQPCSPGFVDGRNAILAADQALYGGANQCLIWTAFAKRGLGFSASQGSTNSVSDGVQAFDIPAGCTGTGCDIVITNVAVTHLTCFNSNNGIITVTATSTHPPINYSITGPVSQSNSTGVFNNLLPGTYTIVVTDLVGATCSATATATVNQGVDNIPPVLTCPPAVTVTCSSLVPAPNPSSVIGVDNCGGIVTKVWVSDAISNQTCANRYTITRVYRGTDASNNSSTCSQVITVNDQTAPAITCPGTVTVSCTNNILPNINSVTASDNCGGAVTIAFVNDVITDQICANKYNTIRTYRATDVCGNSSTCTQTITVNDLIGPVLFGVPANITIECGQVIPQVPNVTATDNCGGFVSVTFSQTSNQSPFKSQCKNIAYDIFRTWTATDICGNTSTKSQVIAIRDTKPPTFSFLPPAFTTVECDDDQENNPDPIPDDACDNTPTLLLDIIYEFNPNGCPNSYVGTYVWTAGDKCGNTTQFIQTIVVNDNQAPEMECPKDILKISTGPTTVSWQAPGASDNCDDNLTVTQTGGPASGSIFLPNTSTTITYSTTDECGNVKTCSFVVKISDSKPNGFNISGKLLNMKSGLISNSELEISGDMSSILKSEGKYEFGNIPAGTNLIIAPKKNTDHLEGINTLDLILTTNHILGKKQLDSPYKILAADVNNSGSLSTSDLLEIRKLILHITDEFKDVNSWEFLPGNLVFSDPSNPWKSQIESSIELEGINADQHANFMGIKMGDVTWDASGNATGSKVVRDNKSYSLIAENKAFLEGETVELQITGKELKNLNGMQFTLKYDVSTLEYVDVKSNRSDISVNNFGLRFLDNGKITASIDLKDINDESLFNLVFKTKKSGEFAKLINLNSDITEAEAYTQDFNTIGLNLSFFQDGKPVENLQPVLYQNEPNPFENTTSIRFSLPEDQESEISFYTLDGKLVKEIKGVYPKGENKVTLGKDDLPSAGMYYYQLSTANFKDIKKLVMTGK